MKFLWGLIALAVAVVAALAATYFAWPDASIAAEPDGLPTVHVPNLAGKVVRVSLHDANGKEIPVDLRNNVFRPATKIPAGAQLTAEAVIRRPGYVGWLRGKSQTVRVQVTAPTAQLTRRFLRTRGAVKVSFDRPVLQLSVDGKRIALARPTRTVSLGKRGTQGTAK